MTSGKYVPIIIFIAVAAVVVFAGSKIAKKPLPPVEPIVSTEVSQNVATGSAVVAISPIASPSATPTPRPLSFAEMNSLYGPCVNLPVLMYHHIETAEVAKSNGSLGLTVQPDNFRKQMTKLKEKGYTAVLPSQLDAFFDSGTSLPSKSVLITFDDGYSDNYAYAYPILRETGMKGVIYLPTGLMENPRYLTWSQISEMQGSGVVVFGNHTWSHLNVGSNRSKVDNEIKTADKQLADHGLNMTRTFAYPYGLENGHAHTILTEMGYDLAFTTRPGRIQCKKQRLSLTRTRMGNSDISYYGL